MARGTASIMRPSVSWAICRHCWQHSRPRSCSRLAAPIFSMHAAGWSQRKRRHKPRGALDDVLKPVQPERLAKTCARLQAGLQAREQPQAALTSMLDQLRALFGVAAARAAGLPVVLVQGGAAAATAP